MSSGPEQVAADELVVKQATVGWELLADWYMRPQVQTAWEELPLELFPVPQLRVIAEAANERIPPDRLEEALMRNGGREAWPFPGDAIGTLISQPTRARTFQAMSRELRDLHTRRKFRDHVEDLRARSGNQTTPELIEALEKARANLADQVTDRFEIMGEHELLTPPGPPVWICEGLALAEEEQPVIIFAPAGEGKSWLAFELSVAVATGDPFAGTLPVKRGKVLYIDYEVGSKSTRRRVQTLLKGRGRGALDGNLRPAISPRFSLDDPRAEDILARETDGHMLCCIDSFAAAYGAVDENSAQVGQLLGGLYRVTKRTGCQFLIVHHARKRKPDPNEREDGDELDALRGSGSIPAQSSAVWSLRGNLAEGAKLTNAKNRVAKKSPGFTLTLCAAADDPRDPAMGELRLEVVPLPAPGEADDGEDFARDRTIDETTERVRDFIDDHPGTSTRRVSAELGIKDKLTRVALERLQEAGRIRRAAVKGRGASWHAVPPDEPAEPQATLPAPAAGGEDEEFPW